MRGQVLVGYPTRDTLYTGAGVDLPLTIFLGGGAFIEPFVYAGVQLTSYGVDPTVHGGYRLGVVF